MERDSVKHSPRVDDYLKHEVDGLTKGAPSEPRVEEFRAQEPPADGEPTPSARPEQDQFLGLGADAPTARREISRFLGLSVFPGRRDALLEHARAAGATQPVLSALERLPADRQFDTVYDVTETLGLHAEDRMPAGRKPPEGADDPLTGHPGA
jgi:hypothetical protein